MVADVSAAGILKGHVCIRKGRKEALVGLADTVRQHVETPAVAHAQHDLEHLFAGSGLVHQVIQGGNQGFRTLDGEALLPDKLGVQKKFKFLGPDQVRKDRAFLLGGPFGPVVVGFNVFNDPPAHLHVLDMQKLDAERAAVGFIQAGVDFAQGSAGGGQVRGGNKLGFHIIPAEPEGIRREGLVLAADFFPQDSQAGADVALERVEVGMQVAHIAKSPDHFFDAALLFIV